MRIEDFGGLEALRLLEAAQLGNAWHAHELELLGLSDEDGSHDDARRLRPIILKLIETAKKVYGEGEQ